MHEDEELQPTDLYEDMRRLNSLYEELCWDHHDILEFYPDYDNNCIVIRNKTMDNEQVNG